MYLKSNLNQTVVPLSILNQEWTYRGEGNANLVLSLPNLRKIVKIRKTEKPVTLVQFLTEWLFRYVLWTDKIDAYSERDLMFYSDLMVHLIGGSFVSPAVPVIITKKEIYDLSIILKSERPECRKNKNIQFGRASLLPDYAFLPKEWDSALTGPTLAIEIKPKQGWVPFYDRQCEKCPFCLNQYVKLKNGSIKNISGYCPLDLFSGSKTRMINALHCLLNNPQNNFRAFKDGICVYDECSPFENMYKVVKEIFQQNQTTKNLDVFINMLCELLLKPHCYNQKDFGNCDITINNVEHSLLIKEDSKISTKCDFTHHDLPSFCVLERILALQMIDLAGLKNNFLLYKYLNSKRTLDNWEYIDKICKLISTNKPKCPKRILMDYERKFVEMIGKGDGECYFDEMDEIYLVPYIVASIANDCSLMVTMRKVKKERQGIENIPEDCIFDFGDNGQFAVNFGIFDLYPKPLSVIQKHKTRNERRQSAYRQITS
ncbi:inositol-pentakisphosphate 2-kinase isoform X2 [Agrilus planipennis]|uniref:Inositol-pentakisphosphate 2-kinase n=1 Tax=Agrilus planipennis TaxID=224129 RepID=A0A1W4XPZ2_AGRPL|nr:inositol-pentakisphosphate 2-kinase isoform X2 [Agrilus planipennis]